MVNAPCIRKLGQYLRQRWDFSWGEKVDTTILLLSHFSRAWLCDPIDGSPPGSPIPGILQARTLEWVAISFSNHYTKQNQIPYNYTVEVTNRFKGLDLTDRVPEELRTEVPTIVQKAGIKNIPKKKMYNPYSGPSLGKPNDIEAPGKTLWLMLNWQIVIKASGSPIPGNRSEKEEISKSIDEYSDLLSYQNLK